MINAAATSSKVGKQGMLEDNVNLTSFFGQLGSYTKDDVEKSSCYSNDPASSQHQAINVLHAIISKFTTSSKKVVLLSFSELVLLSSWLIQNRSIVDFLLDLKLTHSDIFKKMLTSLLATLNDSQRHACEQCLAVTAISYLVELHPMQDSVLSEQNCKQLLRLAFSRAVYPLKHIHSGIFPAIEESSFARFTIKRLLRIERLKASVPVAEELTAFTIKWWDRLKLAPEGSTTMSSDDGSSVPSTRFALECLCDIVESAECVQNWIVSQMLISTTASVVDFSFLKKFVSSKDYHTQIAGCRLFAVIFILLQDHLFDSKIQALHVDAPLLSSDENITIVIELLAQLLAATKDAYKSHGTTSGIAALHDVTNTQKTLNSRAKRPSKADASRKSLLEQTNPVDSAAVVVDDNFHLMLLRKQALLDAFAYGIQFISRVASSRDLTSANIVQSMTRPIFLEAGDLIARIIMETCRMLVESRTEMHNENIKHYTAIIQGFRCLCLSTDVQSSIASKSETKSSTTRTRMRKSSSVSVQLFEDDIQDNQMKVTSSLHKFFADNCRYRGILSKAIELMRDRDRDDNLCVSIGSWSNISPPLSTNVFLSSCCQSSNELVLQDMEKLLDDISNSGASPANCNTSCTTPSKQRYSSRQCMKSPDDDDDINAIMPSLIEHSPFQPTRRHKSNASALSGSNRITGKSNAHSRMPSASPLSPAESSPPIRKLKQARTPGASPRGHPGAAANPSQTNPKMVSYEVKPLELAVKTKTPNPRLAPISTSENIDEMNAIPTEEAISVSASLCSTQSMLSPIVGEASFRDQGGMLTVEMTGANLSYVDQSADHSLVDPNTTSDSRVYAVGNDVNEPPQMPHEVISEEFQYYLQDEESIHRHDDNATEGFCHNDNMEFLEIEEFAAVSSLRMQVLQLTSQLSAAQLENKYQREQIHCLTATVETLHCQNFDNLSKLEEKKVECSVMNSKILLLDTERFSMQQQIQEISQSKANVNAQCEQLENTIRLQEEALQEAWKKMSTLAEFETKHQTTTKVFLEKIEVVETTNKNLQLQCNKLSLENAATNAETVELKAILADRDLSMLQASKEVGLVKQHLSEVQHKFCSAEAKCKIIESEFQQSAQRETRANSVMHSMKLEATKMRSTIAENLAQISQQQIELHSTKEESAKLQFEYEQIQDNLKSSLKLLELKEMEMNSLNQKLHENEVEMKQLLELKDNDIEELKKELEKNQQLIIMINKLSAKTS